jgi:hypothetical protein
MKKSNPLPYLPERFTRLINWLKTIKIHPKLVFFVLGILSTLWFLIRVIPKPSRAAYPCMQATAPYMSAFVLWLTGIGGSAFSLVQLRKNWVASRYVLVFVFLLSAASFYLLTEFSNPQKSRAANAVDLMGDFPPNDPIGVAQGIYPGRVVWDWNPDATNENCDNTSNGDGYIDEDDNAWFLAKNNNYQVIDGMLSKSILLLTGETEEAMAWDQIFKFYNNKNGNGHVGYSDDEIVFIKLNATSAYGAPGVRYYDDLRRNDDIEINPFTAETNPYLVLALLRQLVQDAGVPELNIYVGDPARNIYEEFYNLWHEEFPDIHYLGNELIHPELDVSALGRTPVAITDDDKVFYTDNGAVMEEAITDKLFTIFEDMDYLINVPTLKAHNTGGITLAAKNHFGSFTRTWAMHLHLGLMGEPDDPYRSGYGLYRVQTDIMMHKLLSGKSLLSIIDGLYPSEDALGVPFKWQSQPFNGDWCSSIFVSLDPVAISSVGHDFLRTEYNGPTIAESRPCWDGVDDYLHQAADSSWWPEGMIYDPDNDGVIIASLGVHEHWNDSINKEYSRNLGIGAGIELMKAFEENVGLAAHTKKLNISVFPNPAADFVFIESQENHSLSYQILSAKGAIVSEGVVAANSKEKINMQHWAAGVYHIRATKGLTISSFKIIKQ